MAETQIQFENNDLERTKSPGQRSVAKRTISFSRSDAESAFDDANPRLRESDFRHKQVFKGWSVFWLAYQATGVIYGDIGTSPLYVYSSTFSDEPSRADLLGAVSLIIWTLTLIVTVKYVFIVLFADDEGEGGTFAIYTLLSRFSDIMKRDPRAYRLVKLERHRTNDLPRHNRGIRNWMEKSNVAHGFLKLLAVFGVSLVLADGVLTPAQSVLGAIQGITVADPTLGTSTIIGVSCAILVVLFLLQPFGVHRISSAFAPIVIIWLLFNACFGIYNLAVYDHSILKAFSPYYAGDWFIRNKEGGWISLGGILLAFTGVECLFADMGAFSRRAIQMSWIFFAYPCLLLAYIGQAAYMLEKPSAWSNPFFNTVPPGMFYPSLVLAILAAIVASQATITACFQLLAQIMNSSYFPHIEVKYTSTKHHGQVYIPIANWLLMIGCVIVTAVYNNTTKLGHAYGVCVILVTFITTNLVTLVAVVVWRLHPALVFAVWLPFVTLDGLYLSSAATKVPDGAWFTLLLACILATFFTMWRYGKEKQWICEAHDKLELSSLLAKSPTTNEVSLITNSQSAEKREHHPLSPLPGFALFFDKSGLYTPKVYSQFLLKFRAQFSTVVLLHLRALSVPHIPAEERYEVTKTSIQNVYRLTIRHGYGDHDIVTPDLAGLVYEEVRKEISRTSTTTPKSPPPSSAAQPPTPEEKNAAISARLRHLDESYSAQTLYIIGKQQMRISSPSSSPSSKNAFIRTTYNVFRSTILGIFLWVRENSRNKIEKLNVPVEKLVEVGFVGEI